MNKTTQRMARLIDISAVQASNTEADIRRCAELANQYRIISVHVLPSWTRFLSTLLPEQGRGDVMIGGPVGFPSGGHATDVKVQEARQLLADGAREIDMVVNIGKVLSGDYEYVREDMRRVVAAVAPIPAKVILETHYLNEQQIRRVCEIAVEVGMAWVKTATARSCCSASAPRGADQSMTPISTRPKPWLRRASMNRGSIDRPSSVWRPAYCAAPSRAGCDRDRWRSRPDPDRR